FRISWPSAFRFRSGAIAWYAADSYHARAFSRLGNCTMIRSPVQSPSRRSIVPPCTRKRPPYGSSVASIRSRYSTMSGPILTLRRCATARAGRLSVFTDSSFPRYRREAPYPALVIVVGQGAPSCRTHGVRELRRRNEPPAGEHQVFHPVNGLRTSREQHLRVVVEDRDEDHQDGEAECEPFGSRRPAEQQGNHHAR